MVVVIGGGGGGWREAVGSRYGGKGCGTSLSIFKLQRLECLEIPTFKQSDLDRGLKKSHEQREISYT